EEDWLYDIRLYGYTFHADQASIIFKELNLEHRSLRPYLKERNAFFRSQKRLNRLKKLVSPDDGEDDLDLKMLAVITRAEQPEPFSVLMSLLASFCRDGKYNEEEPGKPWRDIERLGLMPVFRKILSRTLGCVNENASDVTDCLLRVFATDLTIHLMADPPTSLAHFVIRDPARANNCSVFLSQWRTHTGFYMYYNLISRAIGEKLKIDELLIPLGFESMLEVMTFETAEQRIVSAIRDIIGEDPGTDYSAVRETIKRRLDGCWAATMPGEDSRENLYGVAYKAMEAAIRLFELRKRYDAGFSFATAEDMFYAYTEKLFRFDQCYREFHERADRLDMAGWDVLKTLRDKVEDCYSGWFMERLGLKWGDFLERGERGGLLREWRLPLVDNQFAFFEKHVAPVLQRSARSRVFVIVSDAFRFEAAEELTRMINGKYRMKAELTPMLGVLPSCTSLGMAALLPHETLAFKEGSGAEVTLDGRLTNSLERRAAILKERDGTAVKADALLVMSKGSGRKFVKPHRVVYVYHDKIDAVGDKAVSERNTFDAVRKAIDDLYALVRFIINSLNGARVIVTADHGFIYQEKAPSPIDKSALAVDPGSVVKTHKRFILGKNPGRYDNAFRGAVRAACNADADLTFLLPKATNRFNFVGGARFFHGGAMLQEIVIPVITVSEMKGRRLAQSEVRPVGVSLLGPSKKIVTNRPVFRLIQTDPTSDRMKPITLKASLRDENELISNEETITFDSASSSMDERQKSVRLSLKAGAYDNRKEYSLVLRNRDDTEYERVPIYIDIAFANDF
ncbi:MAG: BREX-1 system phosphatase PglZ type A, partial [Desulfobacterales bacterium]|nr:BREX-1 system phosphatase PglZ type A [Desulfobacterales bacterium]